MISAAGTVIVCHFQTGAVKSEVADELPGMLYLPCHIYEVYVNYLYTHRVFNCNTPHGMFCLTF